MSAEGVSPMIYELRFYSVTHGRMADVQSRFTKHLPALFERHGVRCVGAWSALSGPNAPRFVYLMAYDDYAHRETVWASFYGDPEWMRIRTETNAGHEMVERHDLLFLKPNAAWKPESVPTGMWVGSVCEMLLQQIAPGQNAAANEFLAGTYLPLLRDCGAQVLGVFDLASGGEMPALVVFTAWCDAEAWREGRLALESAQSVRDAFATQHRKMGQPCFHRSAVDLLEPVPGVPIHPSLGRSA